MEKEQKVISLELAQKIAKVVKERGVKLLESEWWWSFNQLHAEKWSLVCPNIMTAKAYKMLIPAYDTSELGEMLPEGNFSIRYVGIKKWDCGNNMTAYNYKMAGKGNGNLHFETAKTEAEARGKMLLYLMENNLLK